MTKLGLEHVQHFDAGGSVQAQGVGAVLGAGAAGPLGGLGGGVAGKTGLLGNGGGWSGGQDGIIDGVSSFLGTKDNFQAGSADIQAGTNKDQLNNSYTGVQNALSHQGDLASSLTPQVSTAVANQNKLAQQLSDMSEGRGPNPAQAELNQNTATNVANTAALMAGQRGAAVNPGLITRQAAQQGAATQQQAVGQAATLEAQQQIAAQQNLAGLSGNQISQTGQAITNENQAQQGEQGILQNANTAANNAAVNMQSNINNTNAQTAAANQNENNSLMGGLMKGAASAFSFFADGGEVDLNPQETQALPKSSGSSSSSPDLSQLAELAPMVAMANGGPISPLSPGAMPTTQSFVGQWLNSGNNVSTGGLNSVSSAEMPKFQGIDASPLDEIRKKPKEDETKGSPGVLPGAGYVNGEDLNPEGTMSTGGDGIASDLGPDVIAASKGGKVKAKNKSEKAVTPTKNNYANDRIPALLSEGEIVLPVSVTKHPNAPEKAAQFVAAILAKKSRKR